MRWIFIVLLTLQAATCGQKGPLTLPADSISAVALTTGPWLKPPELQ